MPEPTSSQQKFTLANGHLGIIPIHPGQWVTPKADVIDNSSERYTKNVVPFFDRGKPIKHKKNLPWVDELGPLKQATDEEWCVIDKNSLESEANSPGMHSSSSATEADTNADSAAAAGPTSQGQGKLSWFFSKIQLK
ncbi:hypothetical protein RBB50_000915 [Rhinocladiella similis]